jgi:hypothetical protein
MRISLAERPEQWYPVSSSFAKAGFHMLQKAAMYQIGSRCAVVFVSLM